MKIVTMETMISSKKIALSPWTVSHRKLVSLNNIFSVKMLHGELFSIENGAYNVEMFAFSTELCPRNSPEDVGFL